MLYFVGCAVGGTAQCLHVLYMEGKRHRYQTTFSTIPVTVRRLLLSTAGDWSSHFHRTIVFIRFLVTSVGPGSRT